MMKTILRICLFYAINLLLVAAFRDNAIFEDEDIYNQALPPLPYSGMIVPGTKWCGVGNISTHYDDLGRFQDTDKCCRAHDHCPEAIEPGSTLHSLFNPDIFPRMKCKCEQEFMNCLQKDNSFTSNAMGRAYFGARRTCFDYAHPAVQCVAYQQGSFGRRCIKYTFDLTKPKKWQYFDVPFYSVKK